jgi:hypothetical protein
MNFLFLINAQLFINVAAMFSEKSIKFAECSAHKIFISKKLPSDSIISFHNFISAASSAAIAICC